MKRKHEKTKYLPIFALPVLYLVMWVIGLRTERLYYHGWLAEHNWFQLLKFNLEYLLVGILFYALPYEWIVDRVNHKIRQLCRKFELASSTEAAIMLALLVVPYVVFALCTYSYFSEYSFHFIRWGGVCSMLLSCSSLLLLVAGAEIMENKWILMGYSLVIMFFNAYMINVFSGKFLLALVVFAAEYVLYVIHGLHAKKANIRVVFLSLVLGILSACYLIDITGHLSKLNMFSSGESLITGKQLIRLFETKKGEAVISFNSEYIFSMIKYELGNVWLGVFIGAFVVGVAVALWQIYKLAKESRARAGMALGIVMLFAFMVVYVGVSEWGILPISSISLLHNKVNFVPMCLMLRMFEVREVKEASHAMGPLEEDIEED